ncbi:hypothetical protein Tco_0624938 [Tanacetum coccineum]|uniref:Uncharacterized protein n=1 Tax=Tanacetum coccineum TaxID=301880 RepID=A0ABQ4WFD6_9ASTR
MGLAMVKKYGKCIGRIDSVGNELGKVDRSIMRVAILTLVSLLESRSSRENGFNRLKEIQHGNTVGWLMLISSGTVNNLEAYLSRVINLESKSKAEMVFNPVSNPDSESGANSGSVDKSVADGATVGEGARGVLDGERIEFYSQKQIPAETRDQLQQKNVAATLKTAAIK